MHILLTDGDRRGGYPFLLRQGFSRIPKDSFWLEDTLLRPSLSWNLLSGLEPGPPLGTTQKRTPPQNTPKVGGTLSTSIAVHYSLGYHAASGYDPIESVSGAALKQAPYTYRTAVSVNTNSMTKTNGPGTNFCGPTARTVVAHSHFSKRVQKFGYLVGGSK